LLGLSALSLVNLSNVLAPLLLAIAIDIIAVSATGGELRPPLLLGYLGVELEGMSFGAALIGFFALHGLANVLRYPMVMAIAMPSYRVSQDLRNALVGRLLALPRSFYDRARSGELMSRATADINAVRMMFGPGVMIAIDTAQLITMVLVLMFALDWQLTLVTLLPLPIIAWVTQRLSGAEYRRFEAVQGDIGKLAERARESYGAIRIIQGFAREDDELRRFIQSSQSLLNKNLRLARVDSVFEPTLGLMLGLSMAALVVFGAMGIAEGQTSLGTFVAFLFLVGHLSGPMVGVGWAVTLLQRGRASLHRIDELLHKPTREGQNGSEATPTVTSTTMLVEGEARAEVKGELRVRGLRFRYPGTEAEQGGFELCIDDLLVPAGSSLGIMGGVGSGKSTLLRLFARLYEAPPGTLFIDGVSLDDWPLAQLRRVLQLVPQDPNFFSDSVARNIILGVSPSRATVEGVHRAARAALLDDDVRGFPEGYETLLGERGVDLSGGQRQRLAVARVLALLRSGEAETLRVLLLDDASSALDGVTEDALLRSLETELRGCTRVIVSHRVKAVANCAQLIVLREGRVVEQGSHAELLAKGGEYAAVAAQQLTLSEPSLGSSKPPAGASDD
jgi:ATP-binding cassette subfamily B protein